MAKAELKGQPKVVLTLTEREARFLSCVLRYCIDWDASDPAAAEICNALTAVAPAVGWTEVYNADLDMFEVQEVAK